ncbi:unnamed protein product, partial [Allacma fusca]
NPKPPYANSYIYDILLYCWDAEPSNRPTFSELAKIFLDLLPKNYVKTIDVGVYQQHPPKEYINTNPDYILHAELEPLQMHEPC